MRPGEPMRRREQQCSSDDGPCAGQSNKRRSDCDRRPSENGGRCCQVRRSLQDQQSPALVARHRSHPRQNCKRAVRSNIGSEHQDQRSDCWRRKAQNGDDEQNRGSTAQADSPPVTRQTSAHPSGSRAREVRPGSMSRRATAHAFGPRRRSQKSIPPPGGIAGAGFFSGISPTIASLVNIRPATDAASCSAVRTTLVGSMIPALNMSL